MFASAMKTKS